MARRLLTVDDVLETILDDGFSLSEGESSDEECGDDLYAYLGEPVVTISDLDALTRAIVDNVDGGGNDGENDDGDSHGFGGAEGKYNIR